MANQDQKHENNVPGRFFVDKECTVCTTCFEMAPNNFSMSEAGDHYFVSKQPESEAELKSCLNAVEQCPMGAVGDMERD